MGVPDTCFLTSWRPLRRAASFDGPCCKHGHMQCCQGHQLHSSHTCKRTAGLEIICLAMLTGIATVYRRSDRDRTMEKQSSLDASMTLVGQRNR
jgi:hypothetical protein